MSNQIHTIYPYKKFRNTWCFDDEEKGIYGEPFVGLANNLITNALFDQKIEGVEGGFMLMFSDMPFPGHQYVLKHARNDYPWYHPYRYFKNTSQVRTGNWYYCNKLLEEEIWLCPVLYRFFDTAPKRIYAFFSPEKITRIETTSKRDVMWEPHNEMYFEWSDLT